jgi:tetratricopeptide (TPR) repeat protein
MTHTPVSTERKKLFLSAVSSEFESHRQLLAQDLKRPNLDVAEQKDFVVSGETTLQKLDDYIKHCDAVVHLIGKATGAVAEPPAVKALLGRYPDLAEKIPALAECLSKDDPGISYTQWETYLAIYHERPIFIYRVEDFDDPNRTCPRSDRFVYNAEEEKSQRSHFDRISDLGRDRGEFANEERLSSAVLRDLVEILPGLEVRSRKIAPPRILRHSPEKLFGRETWLDALDAAWESDDVNVYTLVAWGGVGKTSLVAHWVTDRLLTKRCRDIECYFDWSFYSQGTGESRQTSADLFLSEALKFFGDPDPTVGSAWDRGERLAGLVRQHRSLLVLDGIEPLQYPPTHPEAGRLKDQGLEALLISLAMDNPGLCVVTTREHLKNVESVPAAHEKKLDNLLKETAVALLRHLQIKGKDEELEAAWRDAGGHALTLQLLGRFLADAHGGDIRKYKEVGFEEADEERQGRSAFKVMIAYEKWLEGSGAKERRQLAILRLMGLFDRPAGDGCLRALRAEPAIDGLTDAVVGLSEAQWNVALTRLADIDLISRTHDEDGEGAVDAHPLIREYFAKQLKEKHPEAWRAAHSRLFDHLCKKTEHRPDTLAGLQPLYQAVGHGCLAGRQQEVCDKVYIDRILRGMGNDGLYSLKKLGAIGADLGAVAAFFDEPWRRLSPNLSAPAQAWLLNEAALRLRALGRLNEAVEPMRVGMDRWIDTEDWKNSAVSASNLSELEATLGRLAEASADGRRAVDFADQSGDAPQKMINRTTAADALHQTGERAEARDLFVEAERIQADYQPEFTLLYSLPGFWYADLILFPAERAAWAAWIRGSDPFTPTPSPASPEEALDACDEARRRADWCSETRDPADSILDIALDHLTLARAKLYRTLLSPAAHPPSASDAPLCKTALDKLREANDLSYLPKALLTAAFGAVVIAQDRDTAKRLLDEAHLIAKRGPMPLHLADIYLHRARLFGRVKSEEERVKYPWESAQADLKEARRLIEKHGYWRRKEELEDAEKILAPPEQ